MCRVLFATNWGERDKGTKLKWNTVGGEARVGVGEFKGVVMVSVREFYERGGERLPGKKVCFFSPFFCWLGVGLLLWLYCL